MADRVFRHDIYDFDDVEIVNNDFDEMKMFDQVGIVENVFLGKVDNGFDNMDIVHNDTADELAVNDDSFEDIVNNDIVDELALDDFDDVKKMFDKDDNVENKRFVLDKIDIVDKQLLDKDFDKIDIVEKLLLDEDFHTVETDFDHALQWADLVQNQKLDLED